MVPDDKRERFMNIIDILVDKIDSRRWHDLGYSHYSDPIYKFENFDVLTKIQQDWFVARMEAIGAKEVTDIYDNSEN